MTPPPRVHQYSDYRVFLRDVFAAKRAQRPQWTYGAWAKGLGLRSPSTLNMILNGRRHPSAALTAVLAQSLKLTGKETEFFTNLVLLQKSAKSAQVSALLLERIAQSGTGRRFEHLDLETFSAISSWHYYAIREMAMLSDFQEDPEWISRKLLFSVTPKEARRALDTLLALGLLVRTADGTVRSSEAQLDTSSDVASEALKRYHHQILTRAQEALRRVETAEREISGGTFAIRQENLPKAKSLIRKFQRDLCALMEEPGADTVYQLEVAFFPLTKKERKQSPL